MSDDGASPEEQLLFACRSDNLELLQSLVAEHQQLNVNATNSSGSTPLHLAVKFLSTDVLPELLEEEVDVDLREKSREGDTPLHLACRMDKEDDEETRNWVVEQLLSAGADPRIRNSSNKKPVELLVGAARQTEFGEVLYQMLRKAEAQMGFTQRGDVVDQDDDDEGSDGTPSDDE